jgi:recombination protein RecA
MYGKGISKEGSLLDVGVDLEMIKKSGAGSPYEGEQLGQGKENARRSSPSTPTSRDEIETKVRQASGLNGLQRTTTADRGGAGPGRARAAR